VVPTVLVATLGLAVGYPLGVPAGVVVTVVAEALVVWVLVRTAAVVRVDETALRAGRATLPSSAVGAAQPLDATAAALLRGREADSRAYLVLRPWLPLAVRVDVDDPADPAPYWYVSTRHPDPLATAVAGLRDARRAQG
jgi:uncharacterized membrane protein (Fun14 family)